MLGNRSLNQILKAIAGRQHYIALWNMIKYYPDFLSNFKRYLTASGHYPYQTGIKSPIGTINPTLYSYHDLLTVNEIFCRLDYLADTDVSVVVDIGSNIGISALYFLTRNETSRCYLYEPDPKNIEKLKKNLSGYEQRFRLTEVAISDESGVVEFGIEPTGRYGGIGVQTTESIQVKCLNINDILDKITAKESVIDILKIDTEGIEVKTVQAISRENLQHIKKIYLEARPASFLHPDVFTQKQYGSVCQLTKKILSTHTSAR
jgi:FkbM family methyltransferase